MSDNRRILMIGTFAIDAMIAESHKRSNDITDSPLESGGTVNDNIRPLPNTADLDFVISNTPIGEMVAQRDGVEVPVAEFLAYIDKLAKDRSPVSVSTELVDYGEVGITDLTVTKIEGADGIQVKLAIKALNRITLNRASAVVPIYAPSSPRIARSASKGTKPTTPATGDKAPSVPFKRKASGLAGIVYRGEAPKDLFGIFSN